MPDKPTCGTAMDGEVCERMAGHAGAHCAVTEVAELLPEPFERAACRMTHCATLMPDGQLVEFVREVKDA